MDESLDIDLLSASLRADMSDLGPYVEGLAAKLEEMLPARVQVTRGKSGFRGPKLVRKISVDAGGSRLELIRGERDLIDSRVAKVSGGIVLKTESIDLDAWLGELGRMLAVEAQRSDQTRQALERLLLD